MGHTDEQRAAEWRELRAVHAAGLPATTVARAEALLSRYPNTGPAWRVLGAALIELASYERAAAAINRALDLAPPDCLFIPLCEMGNLHQTAGDHAAAENWYRQAIDAAPDDVGPRIYLAHVLAASGKLAEAESVLRVAICCREGCVDEAYYNLAGVLRSQGRLAEAREAAGAALARDPAYDGAARLLRDVQWAEEFAAKAEPAVTAGD